MLFYLKVHKSRLGGEVVAICDEDILGKKFEDEEICFDVKRDFYGGEKVNEETVKKFLMDADNFNIVGKEIIALAVKLNLIDEQNIIRIKGVPHAQGFTL